MYRLVFKLILRRIDPERAHALAARALRLAIAAPGAHALLRRFFEPRDERLRVRALGMTFPSPLGVAAGVDKDATSFDALGALGFGFVEVGTVTALAQPGNPRPRVARLVRNRALLNKMGFPNAGAAAVSERLRIRSRQMIVGVNIGKSRAVPVERAVDDYRASTRELARQADYLVLNVSSPNTPGLVAMQAVEHLRPLIAGVRAELDAGAVDLPLLLKIGPDLADAEIDAVADLALELALDGIVAVNTTSDRSGVDAAPSTIDGGGISGAPLKARAVEVLARLRARVDDKLVLVSVGGIETAEDAWDRIRAGATLLQAYTGFVYGGPLWPSRLNRGLARRLSEEGFPSLGPAVGSGAESARSDHGAAHDPLPQSSGHPHLGR